MTGLVYGRSNEGLTVTPYEWAALWGPGVSTMPSEIILSHNQLTSFNATPSNGFHSNNIDRFRLLNLSHNLFTSLADVQSHDDLVPENVPMCLDIVDLSHNKISGISVGDRQEGFSNINRLYLDNNLITCIGMEWP